MRSISFRIFDVFLNVFYLKLKLKFRKILKSLNLMQHAVMMNSVVRMAHAFLWFNDAIVAMNAEIDQTRKTAVVDRENFFAQQESALSNQGGATGMLIVEMVAMKIIANVSTSQSYLTVIIFIIFGNKFNEKCACTCKYYWLVKKLQSMLSF